ncbi:restriction endonuclease subunit S [Burkholderia gladioli]
MSLPTYPQYKDSGAELLGEVPAHWTITKTKHVCVFTTGWTPPTGDSSAYEGENLWANISDLGERIILDTAKRISDEAAHKAGIALSPRGSLLFSFKLSIGQVSIVGRDMYTNEAIATFQSSSKLSVAYAYYAFPFFLVKNAAENIYGAKLLNQELIRAATLALPPIAEQTDIATFLDRETSKIDALIAEQEKLLTLLAEKRQATISHAVTRGLNPDVPMKDSGVTWLGEVPAHWEIRRVKSVSTFTTSGPRGWSERIGDEGSLFVQSGDLTEFLSVEFTSAKRVSVGIDAEAERTRLADGDVVVCITGAKTGNVAVCTCVPEPAYVNQHLCLIRPSSEVLPLFLGTSLKSTVGQTQFELSQYGLKQGLSLENVREALIVLPPRTEQSRIIAFLDVETAKLDGLKIEAERTVTLLKERRSALIAAAVTGKVDVRNAVREELAA